MSVWKDEDARNLFLGMNVPHVGCVVSLLCTRFLVQLPLLGPCIQAYVDVNELVGPHPLLFHSKTILNQYHLSFL